MTAAEDIVRSVTEALREAGFEFLAFHQPVTRTRCQNILLELAGWGHRIRSYRVRDAQGKT